MLLLASGFVALVMGIGINARLQLKSRPM